MPETLQAEVLHVVPPEELADHDVAPELRELATDRHVLVCRTGGEPSLLDKLRSFLLRRPIEPVTVVTEQGLSEGDVFDGTVRETEIAGVYEAVGEA